MPDSGVLVTTAAQLGHGLLSGDGRYAPWLTEVSRGEGWDEVLLVSEKKVIVFRVGAFFNPDGSPVLLLEETPVVRATVSGPSIAGIVLTGVGVGAAGVGAGLNLAAYNSGLPDVGQTLPVRSTYDAAFTQNRVGLGMVIGGAAAGIAGIVVAIAGAGSGGNDTVAALPWIQADGRGFVVGIGGQLP